MAEDTESSLPTQAFGFETLEQVQLSPLARRVEVHERMDSGRHGVAQWSGTQMALGRPVVVLQPEPDATAEERAVLRREAALLASLPHPNVLSLYAAFEMDGCYRVLLGSVPGATWGTRLDRPWVVRELFGEEEVLAWHIGVLLQVCRALQFAHQRGVVHGDLRPDVVWVGDLGEVYIRDWSHAASMGDDGRLPIRLPSGERLDYFPPEWVGSAFVIPDSRTDVFQLGALLFRIMAGHGPYGEDPSWATVSSGKGPRLLFPTTVPPSLAAVCKRAMATDLEERYPDVRAFANELERAFAQRNVWSSVESADRAFDELQGHLQSDAELDIVLESFARTDLEYRIAVASFPNLEAPALRLSRASELVRSYLDSRSREGHVSVLANLQSGSLAQQDETRALTRETNDQEISDLEYGWVRATLGMALLPVGVIIVLMPSEWAGWVLGFYGGAVALWLTACGVLLGEQRHVRQLVWSAAAIAGCGAAASILVGTMNAGLSSVYAGLSLGVGVWVATSGGSSLWRFLVLGLCGVGMVAAFVGVEAWGIASVVTAVTAVVLAASGPLPYASEVSFEE